MPFVRNVEIGRVAMVNYGAEYGKLVVISDVVDQNKVNTRGQPDGKNQCFGVRLAAIKDARNFICCAFKLL
jgi:ribosomal protein L14E/L6E/L27E